jgi:hypothetical protein
MAGAREESFGVKCEAQYAVIDLTIRVMCKRCLCPGRIADPAYICWRRNPMHEETRFIDSDFKHIKETSWPIIALAVVVDVIVLITAMHVVLPFFSSSLPVERLTNGLVQATLIFSVTRFLLVAVGVAVLIGGLRLRDLGVEWDKVSSGVVVVLGLWIVMQLIGILLGFVISGEVALSPIWSPKRIPPIIGELAAQLLGNAFAEEVIFRGFLLTQIALMLRGRISKRGRLVAASVLLSQLIFSLSHIPQRLVGGGYSPLGLVFNLLLLWVYGALFALLYLRTENIFIVVGVHALANAPITIVAMPSQIVAGFLPLILGLVLIVVWGPVTRWMEGRGPILQQSSQASKQLM